MNNKLTELTEAIHKALPEILERVRCFTGEINRELPSAPQLETVCIGGDITLSDVLRAVNKKTTAETGIDDNGNFLVWSPVNCALVKTGEVKWNLSKPLHLQEQETIDFLHSIIV